MADSEQGIGKKILSFFINDNTEPKQTAPAANVSSTAQSAPTPQNVASQSDTGQIDRKFIDHFVELLEKANLPGPDYFEYKQALRNMDGLGLAEDKQFQAAWASFKAMGGVSDPGILKTSADQYIQILEKDHTSFLKDVEKALKERVGSLNLELKKLEDDNAIYEKQIAEFQKKIEDNKGRLGEISGDITEQSSKIMANRDNFEVTYLNFVNQIKSDLSKINQHLK
jgi:hypothetical protein